MKKPRAPTFAERALGRALARDAKRAKQERRRAQVHPLPGFTVAKLPPYRLLVRHMPWRLWAPYQVSPRYARALPVAGVA